MQSSVHTLLQTVLSTNSIFVSTTMLHTVLVSSMQIFSVFSSRTVRTTLMHSLVATLLQGVMLTQSCASSILVVVVFFNQVEMKAGSVHWSFFLLLWVIVLVTGGWEEEDLDLSGALMVLTT